MPQLPVCYHCTIDIDPSRDEAHRIRLDGDWVTVCDSCRNDHMVFGDDFGDAVRGYCIHQQWAQEEQEREAV